MKKKQKVVMLRKILNSIFPRYVSNIIFDYHYKISKISIPKIHLYIARNAPVAVILVQIEQNNWLQVKWDLDNNIFFSGQWLKNVIINPLNCDLSPDGRLFTYHYNKPYNYKQSRFDIFNRSGKFTVISTPPYFTALSFTESHICSPAYFVTSTIYSSYEQNMKTPTWLKWQKSTTLDYSRSLVYSDKLSLKMDMSMTNFLKLGVIIDRGKIIEQSTKKIIKDFRFVTFQASPPPIDYRWPNKPKLKLNFSKFV